MCWSYEYGGPARLELRNNCADLPYLTRWIPEVCTWFGINSSLEIIMSYANGLSLALALLMVSNGLRVASVNVV